MFLSCAGNHRFSHRATTYRFFTTSVLNTLSDLQVHTICRHKMRATLSHMYGWPSISHYVLGPTGFTLYWGPTGFYHYWGPTVFTTTWAYRFSHYWGPTGFSHFWGPTGSNILTSLVETYFSIQRHILNLITMIKHLEGFFSSIWCALLVRMTFENNMKALM